MSSAVIFFKSHVPVWEHADFFKEVCKAATGLAEEYGNRTIAVRFFRYRDCMWCPHHISASISYHNMWFANLQHSEDGEEIGMLKEGGNPQAGRSWGFFGPEDLLPRLQKKLERRIRRRKSIPKGRIIVDYKHEPSVSP